MEFATKKRLGSVKVGEGINVENGVISVDKDLMVGYDFEENKMSRPTYIKNRTHSKFKNIEVSFTDWFKDVWAANPKPISQLTDGDLSYFSWHSTSRRYVYDSYIEEYMYVKILDGFDHMLLSKEEGLLENGSLIVTGNHEYYNDNPTWGRGGYGQYGVVNARYDNYNTSKYYDELNFQWTGFFVVKQTTWMSEGKLEPGIYTQLMCRYGSSADGTKWVDGDVQLWIEAGNLWIKNNSDDDYIKLDKKYLSSDLATKTWSLEQSKTKLQSDWAKENNTDQSYILNKPQGKKEEFVFNFDLTINGKGGGKDGRTADGTHILLGFLGYLPEGTTWDHVSNYFYYNKWQANGKPMLYLETNKGNKISIIENFGSVVPDNGHISQRKGYLAVAYPEITSTSNFTDINLYDDSMLNNGMMTAKTSLMGSEALQLASDFTFADGTPSLTGRIGVFKRLNKARDHYPDGTDEYVTKLYSSDKIQGSSFLDGYIDTNAFGWIGTKAEYEIERNSLADGTAVYITDDGEPVLNGNSEFNNASIYAPTVSGNIGNILLSKGSKKEPVWRQDEQMQLRKWVGGGHIPDHKVYDHSSYIYSDSMYQTYEVNSPIQFSAKDSTRSNRPTIVAKLTGYYAITAQIKITLTKFQKVSGNTYQWFFPLQLSPGVTWGTIGWFLGNGDMLKVGSSYIFNGTWICKIDANSEISLMSGDNPSDSTAFVSVKDYILDITYLGNSINPQS